MPGRGRQLVSSKYAVSKPIPGRGIGAGAPGLPPSRSSSVQPATTGTAAEAAIASGTVEAETKPVIAAAAASSSSLSVDGSSARTSAEECSPGSDRAAGALTESAEPSQSSGGAAGSEGDAAALSLPSKDPGPPGEKAKEKERGGWSAISDS